MLSIIPTPIGNLQDITLRALETLKTCDYILCEDTRHSLILLSHFEIKKPLKSFHKFNESFTEKSVLEDLEAGKHLALISDAGMPGICDPGERLIQRCIEAHLPYEILPGPCALIVALVGSGLCTLPFQFIGFLPKKDNELKSTLADLLNYIGTTICYESPHRLRDVLEALKIKAPTRKLVVARELTKKFEEYARGTATEILAYFDERQIKGEIVIVIDQRHATETEEASPISLQEQIEQLMQEGLSKNEAIKFIAKRQGVSKRDIYQQTLLD